MPHFGRASESRVRTMTDGLQRLFREVVKWYDCKVIFGHRGEEAQNRAFSSGASQVPWPDSEHNSYPSRAGDVGPYPLKWGGDLLRRDPDGKILGLDQDNLRALLRFYHFSGYVRGTAKQMGIGIRWGGDWDRDFDLFDQTFMDLVHFEEEENR